MGDLDYIRGTCSWSFISRDTGISRSWECRHYRCECWTTALIRPWEQALPPGRERRQKKMMGGRESVSLVREKRVTHTVNRLWVASAFTTNSTHVTIRPKKSISFHNCIVIGGGKDTKISTYGKGTVSRIFGTPWSFQGATPPLLPGYESNPSVSQVINRRACPTCCETKIGSKQEVLNPASY